MTALSRRAVLVAMALSVTTIALTWAGERSAKTVITVGEMCSGCVKKITAKLESLPNVASIQCDAKTRSVAVAPESGTTLSARTLWEAMEEISKTPKKLVGPSGTFTSKPNS